MQGERAGDREALGTKARGRSFISRMLRGHYACYAIGGSIGALQRVHRAVERYWRKMLSSRSWPDTVYRRHFQRIKEQFPLLRPKLYLARRELQAVAAQ